VLAFGISLLCLFSQSFATLFSSDALSIEEQPQLTADEERQNLLARNAIKRSIVAELVAGRLELSQAADGFLEVDRGRSRFTEELRSQYGGGSIREREARSVMAWARCSNRCCADLERRLEQEFQEQFQK
jgi:hypothetical protein